MGYAIRLASQYLVAVEERGPGRGLRVVVTDDPAQARRWADPAAARRFWAHSGLPSDVAFEIHRVPEAGAEVCDFCSGSDPIWVYPAREFAVTAYGWGSSGGWAACAPCADLIERGDWTALAERTTVKAPGTLLRTSSPRALSNRSWCLRVAISASDASSSGSRTTTQAR